LDALLTKGINVSRVFNSTPLRSPDTGNTGFRASTPFLDGGFVALSGPNQNIAKDGIKYVLVNDRFVDAIPQLQRLIQESSSFERRMQKNRCKVFLLEKHPS